MKTTLAILSFLIVLFSGVVWAEGCFVPISQWQPRSAVAKLAEASGWTARRIKIDDGCYEIYGRDTQGRQVEMTLNPATLEVLEIEYEDEDDDKHENDSD